MIILLKEKTTDEQVKDLESVLEKFNLKAHLVRGQSRTVVAVIGETQSVGTQHFEALPYVEKVMRVMKPYKLAGMRENEQRTVVNVDGVEIGGKDFAVIAGPCAIESEEQLRLSAEKLKELGCKIMRASAYKPRTSPYDFQGLREEGIMMLRKIKEETGLLTETEIMDVRDVKLISENVDILRVGARNMQNFDLLKELGKINKPVILKRGMAATISEWLLAAEYVMSNGNPNVILCERGIRTFETATRNTLDISAIPVVQQSSHLPIIVDPSHAAGNRNYVIPLVRAAVAAGADGVIVEAHPNPEHAKCDGAQSLNFSQLEEMMGEVRKFAEVMGRRA